MLRTFVPQVCFQEVPQEISLGFLCTGCQIGCRGCHSPQLWDENKGEPLTLLTFSKWLVQYQGLITCVVFFGGEWEEVLLIQLLKEAKLQGLKTCLYTGRNDVSMSLKAQLTHLKTGPYIDTLGGLETPNTNQRFIELSTGQLLNAHFLKE